MGISPNPYVPYDPYDPNDPHHFGDLTSDDLICFFWNTLDRIYIVSATHVSEHTLVTLADSVR